MPSLSEFAHVFDTACKPFLQEHWIRPLFNPMFLQTPRLRAASDATWYYGLCSTTLTPQPLRSRQSLREHTKDDPACLLSSRQRGAATEHRMQAAPSPRGNRGCRQDGPPQMGQRTDTGEFSQSSYREPQSSAGTAWSVRHLCCTPRWRVIVRSVRSEQTRHVQRCRHDTRAASERTNIA